MSNIVALGAEPVTPESGQNVTVRHRTSSVLTNPDQFKMNLRAAELFAQSDLVPNHYRGKPANCFLAINRAQRLGLDELYFLEKTFIVSGKLGMAAELAIELANSSGRFRGQIKFRLFGEGEARGCTAFATLASDGETVENTVTYAMAKADGWTKNSKWTSLRDQMLQYRAGVFLARLYAGGSMGGMYTREELEDVAAQSAKPIGSGGTSQAQIEAPEVDAPLSPEYVAEFEAEVRKQLDGVETLDALDDLWKSGINAEARALGEVDKAAHKRIIAAFTQRKNDIIREQQPDQDGVDMSDETPAAAIEHEPQQEAQQKPVQADKTAAATERRDNIDNALDELRRGDNGIPAPVAIKVMVGADGSKNWSAFFNAAKAVFREAVDGEYGEDWLARWLDANGEALVELKQANKVADDKLAGMYAQAKDYFVGLRKEAEAEATKEFPTLNVGVIAIDGDEDNTVPNWPAFVRNLHAYLDDTPNHRVAAAWWHRHKVQVSYMAKAGEIEKGVTGEQAAAEFTKALFARFPQIAD